MPETSIVIKAQDRYSDSVKAMAQVTKSFSKETEEMQKKLDSLSKNKATLQIDADKAKTELKALQKQFKATGEESDRMAAELAQQNYDNAVRNLKLVSQEAKEVEKQMNSVAGVVRKTENGGLGTGLLSAGVGKLVSNAAAQLGGSLLSSAIGEPTAQLASSALSGAISGGTMGAMLGPQGILIGAVAGGLSGIASGYSQIYSSEDSAFQSYVQEAVEGALTEREEAISAGSTLAASRETDLISFSTLLGSKETAQDYLRSLVDMANTTPFLYDDLTSMSKTLATYGYGADSILPVLQTIGDAGAALGMTTSDMTAVATALGRMKSSNKTTLEYLNILNDRGIGAVGMLADYYGTDQGDIYSRISKGSIAGTDAVEIILQALTGDFSGSMLQQSKTFSGLTSTLEGMEQEMNNAYGEGYNEARKKGLSDQIDYFSGESGEAMQEANKAIGAWYASLENEKELLIREAQQEVLSSDAYQEAMAAGTDEGYAEAGRMLMEAKIRAQNEYNATDGAKLMRDSELAMIQSVREDTALKDEYWNTGHVLGQEFSKGLAAAMMDGLPEAFSKPLGSGFRGSTETGENVVWGVDLSKYAYGLDRVPYDDFPALLHQGERVLTAREARQSDRGGGVSVQIGSVSFGGDVSDPKAAAREFARELERELLLVRE